MLQFGQQLAERALASFRHAARHQGARSATRPATLHQPLCVLGVLVDQFIALEAVGRDRDAGRADFGHRRRPLADLTARLQPLETAVDDSHGKRRHVMGVRKMVLVNMKCDSQCSRLVD